MVLAVLVVLRLRTFNPTARRSPPFFPPQTLDAIGAASRPTGSRRRRTHQPHTRPFLPLQATGGGGRGPGAAAGALGGPPIKATPTGKIREMEERLRQQRERGGPRVTEAAKPPQEAHKSGLGVWWMIGLYILFHFIFNNNSS